MKFNIEVTRKPSTKTTAQLVDLAAKICKGQDESAMCLSLKDVHLTLSVVAKHYQYRAKHLKVTYWPPQNNFAGSVTINDKLHAMQLVTITEKK